MATLTSFTRPNDPIEAAGISQKITNDIGTSVTAEMLADFTIAVTGTITETNRTAIQTSINGYIYPGSGSKTVTANYTVLSTDKMVYVDTTSGAVVVTLPTAVGKNGTVIEIKKISTDNNVMTIAPNGSELIDGMANKTTTTTTQPSYRLLSNNVGWKLV